MKKFVQLIENLNNTTKTTAKIEALTTYFTEVDSEDKIWAIALLTGRRSKRTVNTTFLKSWATELAQIPIWLFDECYHTVGDLAETISLLVACSSTTLHQSLGAWMQQIIALEAQPEELKKQYIISAWQQLDFYHIFIFNKIITGGLRVGVAHNLLVKALSKTENLPENVVTHRLSGNWRPQDTTFEQLFSNHVSFSAPSKPYPFYLSYPLENEVETLGTPQEWQAEWKWDGLRGQIIKRSNELFIWSRGEELITEKFPELHVLLSLLPNGTVIDGEIICFEKEHPLPFQLLQTRIGRKTVSSQLLKKAPVVVLAYDLIEWQGEDIRTSSLRKRRELLENAVNSTGSPVLRLSPTVVFSHWQELIEIRAQSRAMYAEGIMLKQLDSPYETGRKRGKWWKWKIEPYTIDGVMIYAQKGHGRRADLFTDFTFAVWDGDALVPFAKAYSGLTDKELIEIDKWVKKNTIEKFGPVRSLPAYWVFELAFEGINASARHKSGVALRFPRIVRWRTDKKPEEADHLETLKKLII